MNEAIFVRNKDEAVKELRKSGIYVTKTERNSVAGFTFYDCNGTEVARYNDMTGEISLSVDLKKYSGITA